MYFKLCRYRFLCIALLSLVTVILIGNLYYKSVHEVSVLSKFKVESFHKRHRSENKLMNNDIYVPSSDENQIVDNVDNYIVGNNECIMIDETNATIKTVDMFSKFNFNASWVLNHNGIWQNDFENRYKKQIEMKDRPPLKVFIVPHSHNDPGWLNTFIGYYDSETSKILNLIVDKLTEHEDMRFIWTEISFLDLWWSKASAAQQSALQKLVTSGRLEITTGGWVMTDEANVHLYAMLDQLIEGHQWVKNHFGVAPKIGWSIDPFGQGSTVPHLLAKSGFDGAIIQRIHYSWKEWMGRHQAGDFYWKPYWKSPKSFEYTLLTHNMPFDIYSTRHSCGPHPHECDAFDFSVRPLAKNVSKNIARKADDLMQQYGRTASLFTHNVAMVLMGSDFTFKDEDFFNNHYSNYKQLIDYINANSETRYNGATAQFATPSDYFAEIMKRSGRKFPTLAGDFFPYSDIFSSGTPAYWTGYFTTRPFHKFMSRDLENNLRNAEILFTIVMNKIQQMNEESVKSEEFSRNFAKIQEARRNLALFQHHDAITGTSKKAVMKDYLERLYKSVLNVLSVQQKALEFLLQPDLKNIKNNFLEHDLARSSSETFPTQKVLKITKDKSERIVIFNSLAKRRMEVISIVVSTFNVTITNSHGTEIRHQINPVFDSSYDFDHSKVKYQLLFLVEMEAMAVYSFIVKYKDTPKITKISCKFCKMQDVEMQENDIELSNSKMRLLFNSKGFLEAVKYDEYDEIVNLKLSFEFYASVFAKSGAYLFKPRNSTSNQAFPQNPSKIFIVKGPIASEVTVIYEKMLVHTVRIFNTNSHLDDAIAIVNDLSLESKNEFRDNEMIMKLKTSIKNKRNGEPEFFTDQNGFQWLPRRKVSSLGVEGNYYPITSSMFIQDKFMRLTLATTHAQGATSWHEGELEVMLDRKTAFDDGRGMGESVLDSVRMQHKFILSLEHFENPESRENYFLNEKYQVPSLFSLHLINSLNYPVNTFFVDTDFTNELKDKVELMRHKFMCDTNLVNLRSLNEIGSQKQSESSLLVLHRLAHDCQLINVEFLKRICHVNTDTDGVQLFNDVKVKNIKEASLTGLILKQEIESFSEKVIDQMEIKTYVITYV